MFGFVGCTITRPMCSVSLRPIYVQVSPPFVDLNTPPPGEIELREFGSPVPRYSTFESLGAMAMSPIDATP
jgi:hypothetical protein